MLEVVFDNSIAGSLKVAKGRRPGQRSRGTVAAVYQVTEDGGKALPMPPPQTVEWVWQGAELPGTSADVAPLVLALDMGDLSDMDTVEKTRRKALLAGLYGRDHADCAERDLQRNQSTLDRLKTAEQTGKEVRVWVADWCPGDLCGLYHVCDLLRNTEVPVSLVWAPRERVRPDGSLVTYRGLGELGPEELGALAAHAVPLAPVQRRAYANRWRELVTENASLRAVVNGRLMSVGEDFYDFALRAVLPEKEPVRIAYLLGNALCALNGVGDGWLYRRVLAMLAAGELRQVSPGSGEHPYAALVQKA